MTLPVGLGERELNKFVETNSEVTIRLVGISGTAYSISNANRNNMDYDKFVEDSASDVAVRVLIS